MQLQDMVPHIAARQGWNWRPDPSGDLLIEVPFHGGRSQVVRLSRISDPEQEEVVVIWSVAGDASAVTDPFALLRYSTTLVYGGIAVRDNTVIVKDSMRSAAADDPSLTKAIFHVGRVADSLEAEAYGNADRN